MKTDIERLTLAVCALRLDPNVSAVKFVETVDALARAVWVDGWKTGHGGLGDMSSEYDGTNTDDIIGGKV